MCKPLTLKELKSLEVDEWVWIVNKENNKGYYATITAKCKKVFAVITALTPDLPIHYFFDYGDKWVAYKSKEQAEGKDAKQVAKEILTELGEWEDDLGFRLKYYAKFEQICERYGVKVK